MAVQFMKREFRAYNILVIFAMAFASIAMGYSAAIIGTTLAQPTFIEYFDLDTRPNATAIFSTINGIFYAGAFFGSLCITYVGDNFGRKMSIAIPSALIFISGAILAASVNIGMLIAFRFISGMGSWWLLGAVPVWMTEIVPPEQRGLLVDVHSMALLLGYTWAAWMGFAFFHVADAVCYAEPCYAGDD